MDIITGKKKKGGGVLFSHREIPPCANSETININGLVYVRLWSLQRLETSRSCREVVFNAVKGVLRWFATV